MLGPIWDASVLAKTNVRCFVPTAFRAESLIPALVLLLLRHS